MPCVIFLKFLTIGTILAIKYMEEENACLHVYDHNGMRDAAERTFELIIVSLEATFILNQSR